MVSLIVCVNKVRTLVFSVLMVSLLDKYGVMAYYE